MELFRQLVHKQTDGRTDGRTLLVPKVAIATENGNEIFCKHYEMIMVTPVTTGEKLES